MPFSAVLRFSDPEEYSARMQGTASDLTIMEAGQFAAELTKINLHDLWLQRLSDKLARTRQSAPFSDRAAISFLTDPGTQMRLDGVGFEFSTLVRHPVGGVFYQRSYGEAKWATMSLPVSTLLAAGAVVIARDVTPSPQPAHITPPPFALATLRRLHETVGRLAIVSPDTIAHPQIARGFEQALVGAFLDCIVDGESGRHAASHRRHNFIMRRFHAAVEEHAEQALYIPELCAAIGVPQRTLNLCCQESLGVGAKRFLLLRRMNLANRALRRGAGAGVTVTQIAAQFGFWNFGRFSTEYRLLFGEAPSTTLRTASGIPSAASIGAPLFGVAKTG